MTEERVRVLLVDDEESLRVPLKKYLENNFGYRVDAVASGKEALRQVEEAQGRYDVALIDEVLLTPPDGIEVMQHIKARYPDIECIVFTGWGTESRQRALQAGAFRYLEKPFDNDELAMLIRTAAQQVRLREIGRAILSERNLRRVLERIDAAAVSLALADEAAITLQDSATGKIEVYTKTHADKLDWRKHFKDRELSSEIIQSGQMVRVSDTELDDRVNPRLIETGIRSFLGVPIPGEKGNLGVLYVYSKQPGRFDNGSTVAVIQTLASQAGLAIANVRAFEQTQTHARYMEALVQAAQGLTRTTRLEEQLALTWEFVREQLEVDTFFIALYDRQTGVLRFPLAYDEGQPIEIHEQILGDDQRQWNITGYVVKTGEELYWPTEQERRRRCEVLGIKPAQIGKPCQSCFYLPLKIGDEVVGAISIQSYSCYAFSPILLDACRALGSQLAVALENTKLFEAEARRRREAETLREAALALTTTLDRGKVFDKILTELQKVVPYDSASVQLLKNDRLEIIGGRGFPNLPELLGISFPIDGDNPNREVVRRRAPFIVSDAPAAYKGFTEEPHVQAGIRGWLGVPMLLGDRLIGMIALDKREPGFYTEKHAQLAEAFATQAAIAIENARLFQEAREGRDYIRSLFEGSSAIISPTEPNWVLQAMVDTICQTNGAWRAVVLLVDEGEEPQVLAQSGFDLHLEPATSIRRKGISRQVIQTRQPRFFPDIQAAASEVHPKMIEQGVRAAACLPLILRDEAIGVLWIHFRDVHPFSETEQQALQIYASQAAIAYDNAHRMQELKQMRQAAEAMSRALEPRQALQQIVESAAQVLQADSIAIWSYDEVRDVFIPEELVAVGIPPDELERFREEEPKPGRTADTVMHQGYVAVTDISLPEYDFLGQPTRELLNRIGVRSFQGIALRVGDERLGVLYANYNRLRTFSEDDEAKLRTFANHAALTLKNARLLAQMQRTKDAAKVIAGVTVQEDLTQTLKTIARHTQRVLHSDAVSLYTYNEATGQLGNEWAMEILDPRAPDSARPPSEVRPSSVIWSILNLTGSPYHRLAEDRASEDALLGGRFVRDEGIKAAIGIQLRVGERKVGVMFVNFRSPHRFTSDEITTIQLFADQAAVATSNAQLYEQLRKRATALQALYEAGKAVTSTLTLDEILSRIAEQAWRLTGRYGAPARFTHLALVEDNRLKFKAAYPPEYLPGLRRGVGDIDLEQDGRIGITGRAVKTRQSQLVGDVTLDSDYIGYDPETRTELAVPIKLGERVIGVINAEHPDHNAFGEDDQRDLESLATQAALAIQNARQYDELRRTKGLVGARTALAWMGMVSSAWRHAVDKHALTIREQIQLLRGDLRRSLSPGAYAAMGERLDTIERLTTQILEKPMIPPLSAEEGVALVAINDLVRERARQLWQNDPYKQAKLQLDLRLDNATTVRASPEWLRRAFDILVDNAVEAVAGQEVRRIIISTELSDGRAKITVTDTGPGIPPEVHAKLFVQQVEKPEGTRGFGIGLLIAQAIVQTYGGDIRVESTGPTGTTVAIWLPLAMQESAERIVHVD